MAQLRDLSRRLTLVLITVLSALRGISPALLVRGCAHNASRGFPNYAECNPGWGSLFRTFVGNFRQIIREPHWNTIMPTLIFLWLNAVLYAGFAFWCTVASTSVMRFLGQDVIASQGQLEFLAVYGGLQAGLAAAFAWCAMVPAWRAAGLACGLCLYAGIVLWRSVAMTMIGVPADRGIFGVFALEVALLGFALVAWLVDRRRARR